MKRSDAMPCIYCGGEIPADFVAFGSVGCGCPDTPEDDRPGAAPRPAAVRCVDCGEFPENCGCGSRRSRGLGFGYGGRVRSGGSTDE